MARLSEYRTKIIKIGDKALTEAVKILRNGGLVVYPTETAYGLACDATNIKAVTKVNKIKSRSGKFIPIIISDIKMAEKYLVLNNDIRELIKKFMPGPLTLVAEKRVKTKKLLGGFRIPGNKFARKLAKGLGKPITATSANISGKKPIYKVSEIKKTFTGKVDLIIDAGALPRRKPTTVFDVKHRKILRKGSVTKEQIIKALR